MNGTLADLIDSSIMVQSECTILDQLYVASWWQWPNYDTFKAGFAVRDPSVTVELPALMPILPSGDPIYPLCGPIAYRFEDDPSFAALIIS